jgi:DNA-binding NtrC family response regulator
MGQSQPRGPKVLVVEDDAVSHCIVAASLRRRGFNVLSASSAEEAILILRADRGIELVFSDVVMPGEMDGTMLQLWIEIYRPGLPVILGSADQSKAKPTGHEEFRFFAKPYNIEAVAACIRNLVT